MAVSLKELQLRVGGDLYDGARRLLCPGPGHTPRDRSLSVMVADGGRLVVHSFAGDPLAACFAHLGLEPGQGHSMSRAQVRRERAAREKEEAASRARKLAHCQRVWEETLPAEGSLVETYLHGRGITDPIPAVLRYHPAAPVGYDGRRTAPAMVAMVTGVEGRSSGLHVTFLRPDGSDKADDLGNPKKMYGAVSGGTVRLADVPPNGCLLVGEGIETMLSAAMLEGAPAWACLSSGGLKTFRPPPSVRHLLVAADADPAGMDAALAIRANKARRYRVDVIAPEAGTDWNDALQAGRKGPLFSGVFLGIAPPVEFVDAASLFEGRS